MLLAVHDSVLAASRTSGGTWLKGLAVMDIDGPLLIGLRYDRKPERTRPGTAFCSVEPGPSSPVNSSHLDVVRPRKRGSDVAHTS